MTTVEQLNGYVSDLKNGNSVSIGDIMILPRGQCDTIFGREVRRFV